MTKDVFHKLITLTFDLDMMPDVERVPTVEQIGSMILQAVALRATQSVSESDLQQIYDQLNTVTPDQFLTTFSGLFSDSDIWIQDEVRKLHDEFSE